MNAGCAVLSWAVLSGRVAPWIFTPVLLDQLLTGQGPKSLELFKKIGLKTAADFGFQILLDYFMNILRKVEE